MRNGFEVAARRQIERATLFLMRQQTYGDKQREAQRLKKQEELRKKSNPKGAPNAEIEPNAGKSDEAPDKSKKKDTPLGRSA